MHHQVPSMQNSALKKLGFVLGPLLFVLTLLIFHPEGLSKEANAVLATTLWVAVWWILEVVPIAVTAMLPIILFPITGALKISETTASYGYKYVFLYIGGFILAIAIEKWNLHKRIATTAMLLPVIAPVATPPNAVVFGSGYLKIPDMLRTGIWMNIISIILLTLITYYLLPLLWDFDISVFPESLKIGTTP